MKPSLRDYLYFSKAQRRGVVALLIIIAFSFSFQAYLDYRTSSQEKDQLAYYVQNIEDEKALTSNLLANKEVIKLFQFDPNVIGLEEWRKLGLSAKQAQAILNYKKKGGVFRIKDDLAKMYTISDQKYNQLEPYILLPDQAIEINKNRKEVETSSNFSTQLIIELNTADSLELIKLKGIGPVYASRILKYKELLGGYYSFNQLSEVWGLRDSTLMIIEPFVMVDSMKLKRINVNSIDAKGLAKHPYLDWKSANAIVNYRKQHGAFKSVEELTKIYSLSDSLIQRIFPYLEFTKKSQ